MTKKDEIREIEEHIRLSLKRLEENKLDMHPEEYYGFLMDIQELEDDLEKIREEEFKTIH